MDVLQIVARMQSNAHTIAALVAGVNPAQARWKPTPDEWSILEVVNHLYDEEHEDFRTRIDYMLARPADPFPPTDPPGWVTARRYNERDLAASLTNFLNERETSLEWLRKRRDAAWETAREHPRAGRFTAGDLLAAWPVHDYLHIRQLTELQYRYHAHCVAPRRLDYAGDW